MNRPRPPHHRVAPFVLATIVLAVGANATRAVEPNAATKRWWSHIVALSNDSMRGRDTGSPEHRTAQEYVVKKLEQNGVKAAGEKGFFQSVPLRSLRMVGDRSAVTLTVGGRERPLAWLKDIAGPTATGLPSSLSGPLVFAGSDNAAGLRVEGAILVRLNAPRLLAPPAPHELPKGAITSIGIDSVLGPEPSRWPAQNAVAMTLADGQLPRARGVPAFRFNPATAEALFEGSGHTYKEVLDLATAGKPVPSFELKGTLALTMAFEEATLTSDNVIGVLPGTDPALASQHIVISAHIDGYGVGTPWDKDDIYNGAFDDAAYVATLIDFAERLRETGTKLRRPVLFAIFTGEEKGLLGSRYFTKHLTVPREQLAATVNLDQLRPIFPLHTLTMHSADDSTLGDTARSIATAMGITIQKDPEPLRNLVRRSDNFPFLEIGVPATGFVFGYKPGTSDEVAYRRWYQDRYHTPKDDLDQPWVPEAAAKFNDFFAKLVTTLANADTAPAWKPGSPFGASTLVAAPPEQSPAPTDAPRTYSNPLSIPAYPVGRLVKNLKAGDKTDGSFLWFNDRVEHYRELADPTAIWHDGKWILYPSVDMAWVSADMGATWQHQPLNIRDVGYAPTVVKQGQRFLLMASESAIYASASPLGPFTELGRPKLPEGVPTTIDPMLFVDDDGRLFFYWGCTETLGIYAIELDAKDPTRAIGPAKQVIPFSPDIHPWERVGEHNQQINKGWLEGSWMIKRNGRYYLTYAAGGTEHSAYAMAVYVGASPLGPFTPQAHNPILRTTDGLVTGTAHGSIIKGPGDRWWAFYTIAAGVAHGFERRVGMDPVDFDANGVLSVPRATSTPQWLPGRGPSGQATLDTGWVHLNGGVQTVGSTSAPNLAGRLAIDNDLRTWWQPAEGDATPTLTSRLYGPASIRAVRIAWRDIGLDSTRGVLPGPYRYRVELETTANVWQTVLDRTASNDDLLIDYREITPTVGRRARLVVTGWPKGITPGVAEFTVFGQTEPVKR